MKHFGTSTKLLGKKKSNWNVNSSSHSNKLIQNMSTKVFIWLHETIEIWQLCQLIYALLVGLVVKSKTAKLGIKQKYR